MAALLHRIIMSGFARQHNFEHGATALAIARGNCAAVAFHDRSRNRQSKPAMLAVLMLATRRVNWYELRLGTTDGRDRIA